MNDLFLFAVSDLYNMANVLEDNNPRLRSIVAQSPGGETSGNTLGQIILQEMAAVYSGFVHKVAPTTDDIIKKFSTIVSIDPAAFEPTANDKPSWFLEQTTGDGYQYVRSVLHTVDGVMPSISYAMSGCSREDAQVFIDRYFLASGLMVQKIDRMRHPEMEAIYSDFMKWHVTGFRAQEFEPGPDLRADAEERMAAQMAAITPLDPGEKWQQINALFERFDRNVGLHDAKHTLRELRDTQLYRLNRKSMGLADTAHSNHMFLVGPPGTGKTTTAEAMYELLLLLGVVKPQKLGAGEKPHLVKVTPADLIADIVGGTRIKTRKRIEEGRAMGVLFIDEAGGLPVMPGSKEHTGSFAGEAVTEIVAAMDAYRDELIFIFAGYEGAMDKVLAMDEGLQGRFPLNNPIKFLSYTDEELVEIMVRMAKDRDLHLTAGARKQAGILLGEARECDGDSFANARAARNMLEAAERKMAQRLQQSGKLSIDPMLDEHDERSFSSHRTELMTITLEDMRQVKSGWGSAPKPKAMIGFRAQGRNPVKAATNTKDTVAKPATNVNPAAPNGKPWGVDVARRVAGRPGIRRSAGAGASL